METTELPFADVAFAAGFASLRQFNDTVRQVFARAPREMRRRTQAQPPGRTPRHEADNDASSTLGLTTIVLRLPFRPPFDAAGLLGFFAARAVPGLEEVEGATYRRTLRLAHGPAVLELSPGRTHVATAIHLADLRDLAAAVNRCRAVLDLDADPQAVVTVLGMDPLLAPLVRRTPGTRVPGAADGAELAVRAILGQQVSVVSARRTAARIVASLGDPLTQPFGTLTGLFPSPETLAAADPAELPVPAARAATIRALARELAARTVELDPGADRDEARERLLAIPGIGPWTAEYIAMRALADTDAFPATDLGVLRGLAALGAAAGAQAATALSERWRPWRAYAAMHLWSAASSTTPRHPFAAQTESLARR